MGKFIKLILIVSGVISGGVLLSNVVFAKLIETNESLRPKNTNFQQGLNKTTTPSGWLNQIQNRLEGKNLKSCQARENAIKKRSSKLIELAKKMLSNFDLIATKVKEYYTNKMLPSGKTVPNYNTLLSEIAAKKTTVESTLASTETDVTDFVCNGNNPKEYMTKYREDMQTVKEALKNYRTSIKNLIVTVRSITGELNSQKPSMSPKPTRTPKTP